VNDSLTAARRSAALRRAAAAAARRPRMTVPGAAAFGAAVLGALAAGGWPGVLLGAAGAAVAAAAAIRYLERDAGPSRSPAGDTAGALAVVTAILGDLLPGPEQVSAADPLATAVDWDPPCPRDEQDALPGDRADKMLVTAAAVRARAVQAGLLHRIPQVLLVAEDGAVVELLGRGGLGRTGRISPEDDSPAQPPGTHGGFQ